MIDVIKDIITILKSLNLNVTISDTAHTSTESIFYNISSLSQTEYTKQYRLELNICSKSQLQLLTYVEQINNALLQSTTSNILTSNIQTIVQNGSSNIVTNVSNNTKQITMYYYLT